MSHRRFSLTPPPPTVPSADAFVMMPLSALPPMTEEQAQKMRELYQWAFEQAAADQEPEQNLLGMWN